MVWMYFFCVLASRFDAAPRSYSFTFACYIFHQLCVRYGWSKFKRVHFSRPFLPQLWRQRSVTSMRPSNDCWRWTNCRWVNLFPTVQSGAKNDYLPRVYWTMMMWEFCVGHGCWVFIALFQKPLQTRHTTPYSDAYKAHKTPNTLSHTENTLNLIPIFSNINPNLQKKQNNITPHQHLQIRKKQNHHSHTETPHATHKRKNHTNEEKRKKHKCRVLRVFALCPFCPVYYIQQEQKTKTRRFR